MDTLLLYPTSTASWYALVSEAESQCKLELGQDVESYLVFLLMRFTGKPEMVATVLALEFLEGFDGHGKFYANKLKDVGDKCLLFAGLFPEHAKRKRVQESYFVDIGRSAYDVMSTLSESEAFAQLFCNLSLRFTSMRDVLQAMRKDGRKDKKIQPTVLINPLENKRFN